VIILAADVGYFIETFELPRYSPIAGTETRFDVDVAEGKGT
jgi:hypothetical protein